MRNKPQALNLLLNADSDVNIKDGDGVFIMILIGPDYEIFILIYGITPYLLAKQNGDEELMQLMDNYKSTTTESAMGGCTFLGLCAPDIGSNANLQSVPNDDVDLFEL
ncbi:hypothetical protein M9Y10_044894 [Tritrichomonas musculus]|uniref:Uncharacterized protein n=1 Tax=Tritrichomonas musculus TaxID=1915356 RepID=A0ABR2JU03_9EUKA